MVKSLRVGVCIVGVAAVLYVGLSIGAAMKGRSAMVLYELGKCVIEARASRHTVADRVAAIVAKKPQLKSVAESAGGKLRILVFKPELEKSPLQWYDALCSEIESSLKQDMNRL